MKIQVGTSGYGYKEWKGLFYPEKISPGEMLRFYGERLSAVEINYTFYHMPTGKVLLSWMEQVPDGFVFSLKAPQVITHRKRLKNVEEETEYFFKTLSVLDNKMGPVLFQFPKSFRADLPVLKEFLAQIPGNIPCAFEFRSPTWLVAEVLELLAENQSSLCMADTDENPGEEIISTAPWGYLRFRRSNYSEADQAQWLERIRSQKWKQAFVFFKHEGEARGPEMAMHFQELAGARGRKSGRGTP